METGWQGLIVDKGGAQALWLLSNHGDKAPVEDGAVNTTAEEL